MKLRTPGKTPVFHLSAGFLFLFAVNLAACAKPPEGMVAVSGGSFTMGTNQTDADGKAAELGISKPWYADENPAHRIDLPTFFIDVHEVTNAAYRTFAQETGRRPPQHWAGGQVPEEIGSHPVTHVSWDDANAFCLWAEKRLPTEAEWEKAARGPNGSLYPWGNQFKATAANINAQIGTTTPVGRYEEGKSPYGAYDMVGNVWEWTATWYAPYPGGTYESQLFGEKVRVLRGNSWAGLGHFSKEDTDTVKAYYSRAGHRLFLQPQGRLNDVGFRCVKSKS
ncbi:MAG TPA: formylglycine-generating enzyme family protein [Nitrospiria bacterium]